MSAVFKMAPIRNSRDDPAFNQQRGDSAATVGMPGKLTSFIGSIHILGYDWMFEAVQSFFLAVLF